MAYLNGRWLTDIDVYERQTGRRLTRQAVALGYRQGWILRCECGFPMVAGVDHTCDPVARRRRGLDSA